jgi:hypothetical protein
MVNHTLNKMIVITIKSYINHLNKVFWHNI